eukprot:TRINITY_DN5048_c0_g2_i1.p1 TRINITY_DN5048_c0_g2~~TRINITY_DN5048_c0_g2_i1.p1  ORF type:complete len:545 (-),score=62.81 TRINITY_DN5048_c0_g2_i1:15-1469(-)
MPPDNTPIVPDSHIVLNFSRYHTVQGGGTLAQLIPMLYGGLRHKCFTGSSSSIRRNMSRWLYDCLLFNLSAPAELRRSGYRLAFSSSLEEVTQLVARIKWDYMCPFLGGVFGQSDDAGGDAVCMGPDHLFEYVLRWNMQFLGAQGSAPFFLYSHFTGHHHNARTLEAMDVPVRDHLLEAARRNPDAILILMGDHGIITKFCDQSAPILNVLVPRSLVREQPKMFAALAANRDLVVSPWDLFATLHHIAFIGRREGQLPEHYVYSRRRTEVEAAARDGDVDSGLGMFSLPLARGITHIEASPVPHHQKRFTIDLAKGFAPRSIFEAMPPRRGCRHAGIEKSHCKLRVRGQSVSVSCIHNTTIGGSKKHVLPTGTVLLVCNWMEKVAPLLLSKINTEIASVGGEEACQFLTVQRLQSWSVIFGVWSLRIETNEGEPNAIYDFQFHMHDDTHQVRDISFLPVTRYNKYAWCTPKRLSSAICICGLGH